MEFILIGDLIVEHAVEERLLKIKIKFLGTADITELNRLLLWLIKP